jgi:predicted AAA+ superfamily ATPase
MQDSVIIRFFKNPDHHFFLLGPRGTGKSTWLQEELKETAIWIDLLNPEEVRKYLAYPERLKELLIANSEKKIVVIDEIQKAPELLSVVHSLIEEKKGIQFILTGSSARKLKQSNVNLLGGRAMRCLMHPFMAAEIGKYFSLEGALKKGMLPLIFQDYQNDNKVQNILQGYVDLYLKEEVLAEGLVRSLENFSRFLEVMTFSHASLINVTNIAVECQVKRKTVENYISILEDLLLGFHIPIFTKRAQRQLSSHPKFYFFDPGVFYALRPKGPLDRSEEIEGASLEGLVAMHLRAWIDYQGNRSEHSLHFWRTRSGVEVDFIVYGPRDIWAIEVKNSKKIGSDDVKSLLAFQQDYPIAKTILLYRGTEKFYQKNVLVMPCGEFLMSLNPSVSDVLF